VNGDQELCQVPCPSHVSDLNFFQAQHRSLSDYEQALRRELEVLYAEGATRRPLSSLPLQAYVGGRPTVSASVERFLH
jgi:hypothetical protein